MNIFTRFFESIKKWFRPSRALPAPTVINDEMTNNFSDSASMLETEDVNQNVEKMSNSSSIERIELINELKIQQQEESPELLNLQARFESNQIQLAELTDEELESLNDLYQRQIDELKEKINKTKTQININMSKLESSVSNS